MSDQNTSYAATALSRLIDQFQGSVKLRALTSALVDRVQDLEDAAWPLLAERSIDLATGDRLDGLGQIVGLDRGGLNDADYRVELRGEFAILSSSGTAEYIISVAQILQASAAAFNIRELFPKWLGLDFGDHAFVGDAIRTGRLIRRAVSAATDFHMLYQEQPNADTFSISTATVVVQNDPDRGFANDAQTTGGRFAGVA